MSAHKGIGRQIQFGVARETSRGTPESAATYWHPWSDHSVDEKDARVQLNQSNGRIEDGVGETIVRQWSEFALKAPLDDTIAPLYFYSLLGTYGVSGPTDTSVYTHTFSVAQTPTHQSLSLFSNDDLAAQDYKYGLGVVTSCDINYTVGQFVEIDMKLKAKKGATATLTPAVTSINRFHGAYLVFKYASSISGLNGASAVTIRSAKLSIQNNIEDDHNLGSLSPTDFVNKQFKVTGEITALWADETYKTLGMAGTAKALRFDLIDTDVVIGSGTANPEIQINIANAVFGQPIRTIKLGDMTLQTIPFTAYYSAGDSETMNIVVTNLVSTY